MIVATTLTLTLTAAVNDTAALLHVRMTMLLTDAAAAAAADDDDGDHYKPARVGAASQPLHR